MLTSSSNFANPTYNYCLFFQNSLTTKSVLWQSWLSIFCWREEPQVQIPVNPFQAQLRSGRDEKGCLLSTKKNAAVDVNCQRQPVETVCLHLFYWSCQPYCSFLLVDVNREKCSCRQRWHFSQLIGFFLRFALSGPRPVVI